MIIACATDENYAEMAAVLLRSLVLRGDVGDAKVVLVGDRLSQETIEGLRACAAPLSLRYIDLGEARQQIADLQVSFFSTAAYIRLMLPDLLSESGRLLYLDCDILVNRSLQPLIDIDLESCVLGAVEDAAVVSVKELANIRLGRPSDAAYFNSGVLLFDLDRWRKLNVGTRCIQFAAGREDYWPDQDALNAVLDGKIKALDRTWNFFSHDNPSREDFQRAHIIHFIPQKPLSPDCTHPMLDDYFVLRDQTPWRGKPLSIAVHKRRIALMHQMVAQRAKRHKQQQTNS